MINSNEQSTEQTKKCPLCKENILIDAIKCKHCRADLRSWFAKHPIITTIIVLYFFGLLIRGFKSGESNSNNNIVAVKISAINLFSEYEENEIGADGRYKDKLLEVTGTIGSIGKDILNNSYITLKTNNSICSIQCFIEDSEEEASRLKEGQFAVIEGFNSGKLMNIILKKCKIKDETFKIKIDEYTKNIELDPNNHKNYVQRAFYKQGLHDYRSAINDYSKAIDINPKDQYVYVVYTFRALTKYKIGDKQGAIEDLNIAKELGDPEADMWIQKIQAQ